MARRVEMSTTRSRARAQGTDRTTHRRQPADAHVKLMAGRPVADNQPSANNQGKNSKASTGRLVIKNSVADTALEAQEECNILFDASISFREREWTRDYEHHKIVIQEMRWKEWTSILKVGKYSWLHPCTQRSVLGKITLGICTSFEIQVRNQLYRDCSMWPQNWFSNENLWDRECQNWVGELPPGKSCPWWTTKKWSNSWRQQFKYSQTLCCALEKRENFYSRTSNGRSDWNGMRAPNNTENWMESIEFEWWIFPGHTPHCRSSEEIQELIGELNSTPENFPRRIIFMSMFNDIISDEYLRSRSHWCLQLNIQEIVDRWQLDLTITQQSRWKITCAEIRKIIRCQFSETYRQGARVVKKTGWTIWTPSSSASWWQSDRWDRKESESIFQIWFLIVLFVFFPVAGRISFTVDEIHCNRRVV